jgi:hypothetical protein
VEVNNETEKNKMARVNDGDEVTVRDWYGEDIYVKAVGDELPDDGTRWTREFQFRDELGDLVLAQFNEDRERWEVKD